MITTAVFRVDASPEFGTGHVARSRNLAHEFKLHGVKVFWAATPETFELIDGLDQSFYPIHIPYESKAEPSFIQQAMGIANETKPYRVLYVQDGYHMDGHNLTNVQCQYPSIKTLVIDERCNRNLGRPDILVDPSFHDYGDYHAGILSPQTKLLSGGQYQMLSPLFNMKADDRRGYVAQRNMGKPFDITLMNGGMNIGNLLGDLVGAFAKSQDELPNVRLNVYARSKAHHYGELLQQCEQAKKQGVNIVLHTDKIPDYTEQDLYIGAAGTSVYELSAAGGLASILIGAGFGQDTLAQGYEWVGAAKYAGQYLKLELDGRYQKMGLDMNDTVIYHVKQLIGDRDLLNSMHYESSLVCDGRGAERIFHELQAPNIRRPSWLRMR